MHFCGHEVMMLARGRGHCHVYVVRTGHPSIARLEAFRAETGQRAYPQVEG